MRSPSRGWAIPALVLCTVTAEAAPPVYLTYWGDLHGHTMSSPVTLTPPVVEGYIRYARDTKALNFVALTEKDFDLSDAEWADCKAAAAAFTSGSFVALSAYEWGDDQYGDFGHRPVYFLTDNQNMVRSNSATTGQVSEMLDRILANTNGFTSIAHPDLSNYATDWDYFDGAADRITEIYSRHGHYETGDRGIQQALAQGHRFGFVGVSDTRSATPGSHGLTAVLATSLSKSNVHAALKARRCYATSGARILLRATMDGREMGEEYTSSSGPTLSVNCTPVGNLRSIEVIKNNVVVYTYMPAGFTAFAPSEPWKSGPDLHGPDWMSPESAVDASKASANEVTGKAGSLSRFRTSVHLDAVPGSPILLADDVHGEYRLFVNGRLLVDTRLLLHDDPDAPHACGGEDAHERPGSPALYRRLGFYDLSVLGVDLRRGDNVIAVECDAGTTAAPNFRLASAAPAGAPVSFNWADTNFTGPSFYYVRVTQTDGHQAWGSPIWVDRTAPDTTPPLGPVKLRVSKDGNDAYLDWPKVTKDTAGNIENVSFYRIFRGTTPDFTPDRTGFTNQIGTSTKSRYRDSSALSGTTNYFYRVTAVDAAGNESAQLSNLGFKVRRPLPFHAGISNIFWISIPYQPMYDTASELVRDLNGGSSGPVTKVVRWDVVNQRPDSYVYLNGRWMGPNFALVPGQAVAVTLKQAMDAVLVGAHDEGTTVRLTNNPSRASLNWVCVPVHTPHVLASQLVQDANGGFFPGPVTRITRLNPDTQANQIYQWNGTSWSGTNFVLVPGEAYGFEVQSTSDWLPATRP